MDRESMVWSEQKGIEHVDLIDGLAAWSESCEGGLSRRVRGC